MTWFFHFHYHDPADPEEDVAFDGQVQSMQCTFVKRDGARCRRRCAIGLPCCYVHLPVMYKVRIRPSLIPGAGKGLFAYSPNQGPNDIVFRGPKPSRYTINKVGDRIVPYMGEKLTPRQADARYGEHTGPYVLLVDRNRVDDGALHRGVGSLLNNKPHSQANCEFVKTQRGVEIYARKNIRNNEELTVNYGKDYHLNEPGVQSSTNTSKYRV